MTPGQARYALLSFLLVTIGVAVNALFLQARPAAPTKAVMERAPSRATFDRGRKAPQATRPDRAGQRGPVSAAGDQPLHIARFALASGRIDGTPEPPQEDADAETVRAIQRELAARGYGALASDGVASLATRAAIMAFEHDQGLALTGVASERILKRILLGASAAIDPVSTAGAGKVRSAQAEEVVRTVQQWLAALDYRPGQVDGRLGADTVKAIRDFEVDNGLVPRGRISADLVARLGKAAAPAKSAAR
jgi:peptidoglycan hydrolase-like protein with peptidoglycan-binding domain